MGTPVRDGALTPKDLGYYAPRKLRDDASDMSSFQFSLNADELQNREAPGDPKPDAITPLPDIFHPHDGPR